MPPADGLAGSVRRGRAAGLSLAARPGSGSSLSRTFARRLDAADVRGGFARPSARRRGGHPISIPAAAAAVVARAVVARAVQLAAVAVVVSTGRHAAVSVRTRRTVRGRKLHGASWTNSGWELGWHALRNEGRGGTTSQALRSSGRATPFVRTLFKESTMAEYRVERDSMGDVRVPAQAYYGAQTQRAVENFPISGWPLPPALVHALGLVKLAAAMANRDLGKLTGTGKSPLSDAQVKALLDACREVAARQIRRRIPHRRVPDRLGHLQQHERQRSHRQPSHRAFGRRSYGGRQADPSQRPREHGAEHQRHVPHGDSRGRGRGNSKVADPGPGPPAKGAGTQGRRVGQDHQDRPHAPGRRHALAAGPGNRRVRAATGAVGRAGQAGDGRRAGTAGRRHRSRRRHQHAPRVRPSVSPRRWRRKPASRSSRP